MRRLWCWCLLPWLVLGAGASCASTKGADEVLAERATAAPREYAVGSDVAWRLVGRTFEMAGFTDVVEQREKQSVTARRDLSAESAATIAAAWIEPVSDATTRVRFKTMREKGSVGRPAASEEELHTRLAGLVGLEGR